MKQFMTVTFVAIFLTLSFTATAEDLSKPAPEIVKCEDTNSCEMTKIEKLDESKKEKKTDKK